MSILTISKLSKSYSQNLTFSLKALNASFPNTGFVSILGKSGCGKSTLLHCLGLLEPIDSGSIMFNNADISKYKDNKRRKYLNKDISYVFQNYQLIEDKNLLINVALPLLIAGERKNYAIQKASELLEKMGFDKEFQKKLVNTCSGGEKQRVAIARAFISNPKVILADEPTGALDTKNSNIVSDLLKKYSIDHLVILVTHNIKLAEEYSDRIITLQDGKIISDYEKNKIEAKPIYESNDKYKPDSKWTDIFINHNLKKRFKRNLLTGIALGISIVFTFLLIGFTNGASKEIEKESLKHFDIGAATVNKQESTSIEKSRLSLVKEIRPSSSEINEFITENDFLTYGLNYNAVVPEYCEIRYNEKKVEEISYSPVYSFLGDYVPPLLIEGRLPKKDCLNEVVINKACFDLLKRKSIKIPLNQTLNVQNTRTITTYFDDELNPYITDYFVYEQNCEIVGVVDELNFLSTPKIYYSYVALDEFLDTTVMNNLSSYLNEEITYKTKIDQCSASDELGSYSFNVFLKDYKDFDRLKNINSTLTLTSNAETVKIALSSFIEAATMGIELFLVITILASILILGITSFASYSQDQHQNAILMSLGANRDHIFLIYVMESLIIGIFSFLISIGISYGLSYLANMAIFNFTGFSNIIQIPFRRYLDKPFLLPIIAFAITGVTCILSTYIPMAFSKKNKLMEELKEE